MQEKIQDAGNYFIMHDAGNYCYLINKQKLFFNFGYYEMLRVMALGILALGIMSHWLFWHWVL